MKKFFRKFKRFSNIFTNAFIRRFGVAIASIIIGLIISFFQSQVHAIDIEWNDTEYTLPDIPANYNNYNVIVRSTNTASGIAYLKSMESIDGLYYDTSSHKLTYGSNNAGLQCSCNYINGDTSWGSTTSISSNATGMNNCLILWADFDVLDQYGDVFHSKDEIFYKGAIPVNIYTEDYELLAEYITNKYEYWFILENQYVQSSIGNGEVRQQIQVFGSNTKEMWVNIYDDSNPNSNGGNSGNVGVRIEGNADNTRYYIDRYEISYVNTFNNRYNYNYPVLNFNTVNFTPDTISYGSHYIINDGYRGEQVRYYNQAFATAPTSFTHILASNYDVKDYNGAIIYHNSSRRVPELTTPIEDLENLEFDYLSVDSWGYSDTDFYMLIYDRTYTGVDPEFAMTPQREILINKNSPYYKQLLSVDPTKNCIYWIPLEEMGIQFSINGAYEIRFGIRNYYSPDGSFGGGGSGGGFREGDETSLSSYYYEFIGNNYSWTLSPNLTQGVIDNVNKRIELTTEQRQHYDTVNSINDINFFMRNGKVGDGVISLPTVVVPDTTFGFFDTLFVGLREAFTTFNDNSISFSLLGHTYNIYPSNFFLPNNDIFNALRNILSVFWYIQIYLYILKDVYIIAQAVESGSFAGGIEGSVKADMV